ncbi:MAG: hypothetical protein RL338_1818 [Chloroflexota bacterium]
MSRTRPTRTGAARPRPARALAALLASALAVAACAPAAAPPATTPGTTVAPSPTPTQTPPPTRLVVGLGYIPSVQFAPFYLADQRGYYRDAGLEVELQNKIDPELVTLVAQGAIDIGSADGTSVIPAVSQGIPVRYVATIYGTNPSIVFAKASSGIAGAADLAGRSIGIPGLYGSSWVMLQALLASAGLTPDDVSIEPYPDFGQGVAVAEGAVDAATGFANNEPVQLQLAGEEVVVLRVPAETALPGPGLVASVETIAAKGEALRAFVAATLRAMEEIAADPAIGLAAATAVVPELAADPATQRAILEATIATWASPAAGVPFGAIDRAGWASSVEFMAGLGLVARPVTVDELVTEELLPR